MTASPFILPDMPESFQLTLAGDSAPPDLMDIWQTRPAPSNPQRAVSFGAGDPGPDQTGMARWAISLPADLPGALELIKRQEEKVSRAENEFERAANRLALFQQKTTPGTGDGVSFSLETAPLPRPELELAQWMAAPSGAASFGLGDELKAGLQEAARQAGAFFEQVKQFVANFALVETVIGGVKVAQTAVGWLGDFNSLWKEGISPGQAQLHRHSLLLVISSKAAWLRLALHVLQGAMRIAAMLGSGPLGIISAIPAAWKFISQVLADFRQATGQDTAS